MEGGWTGLTHRLKEAGSFYQGEGQLDSKWLRRREEGRYHHRHKDRQSCPVHETHSGAQERQCPRAAEPLPQIPFFLRLLNKL